VEGGGIGKRMAGSRAHGRRGQQRLAGTLECLSRNGGTSGHKVALVYVMHAQKTPARRAKALQRPSNRPSKRAKPAATTPANRQSANACARGAEVAGLLGGLLGGLLAAGLLGCWRSGVQSVQSVQSVSRKVNRRRAAALLGRVPPAT
jgi:hypothetical protein